MTRMNETTIIRILVWCVMVQGSRESAGEKLTA